MTAPGYPSKIPLKFRSSGGTQEYFIPLAFPPGVFHNGTRYEATGRWYHSSRVRWYQQIIGPIGGWRKVLNSSALPVQATGKMRQMFAWHDNAGASRLIFGGATKLYAYANGVLSDVTPAGFTTGAVDGGAASGNYGLGLYGTGYYGTGTGGASDTAADTWQFDSFGEIAVACMTGDGKIYQLPSPWTAAATVVAGAPTGNAGVVVTPERFVVALGAGGNPRLVQWDDQGAGMLGAGGWTPAVGAQAGSFPIQARGRLLAGRRLKAFTMLWTDVCAFQMIYIGAGANAYAFQQAGDNCGLISPNAPVVVGQNAYWMSRNKFYCWDGVVRPLDCDVLDYVFGNLNNSQRSKIVGYQNTMFDEITWLYPSLNSLENDSYVTYNYRENTWYYGALQRNTGTDRGVFQYPTMIDQNGFLYEHEVGNVMDDGLLPFLESGPYEIAGGDQVVAAQRLLSDEATLGDVMLTLFGALNPTDAETQTGPIMMAAPLTFRMGQARYIRARFDQVRAVPWRIGVMRLGVVPGGFR